MRILRNAALALVLLGTSVALRAQDSRPAAPPELAAAVEKYLAEVDDAAAARALDAVLGRADATPENVAAALLSTTGDAPAAATTIVPHHGLALATTIKVPLDHSRESAPLPVVFDISGGGASAHLGLARCIVAYVEKYTPPEFSDEGRDGFLKVLRTAAHRAHGDPERLWLCGFSWAGHASCDTALHRPGAVRGIVPMGGGPRRVHFRVLKNLEGVQVAAFCGQKDDAELIWNLKEMARLAPGLKFPCLLDLDPNAGHTLPLAGIEKVAGMIEATGAGEPRMAPTGVLVADMAHVESAYLRFDAVDETKTAAKPVAVSAGASYDEQRRATLSGMAGKVAKLSWKLQETKNGKELSLTGEATSRATVFLRAPSFNPGAKLIVRAGGKTVMDGVLAADARTMLEEARRTGDRAHLVWRKLELRL